MQVDVRKLRTKKEIFYFVLIVFASIGGWYWLLSSAFKDINAFFASLAFGDITFEKLMSGLSTPIFLLIFFVFGLFFHLLAMAHVRLNAIKVGPNQLPELFEGAKKLCGTLGISKQPDVFVMNGNGILNAFAARLVTRRLLIVYSDLADALIEGRDQGQLEAVLSHELGHHELGHTSVWNYFIQPGLSVPGLGHAYSRAREYSCDRVMKAVVSDQIACERALIKLAGGKSAGEKANIDEYVEQKQSEGGFFAWLSEKLSTHPHLPNRIAAIRK
ncbi:MAG: M48 family metallopeptidase [Patescibacteria group bacterium]